MTMKTITLQIPDSLGLNDRELLMLLAVKLYEQGNLSLGQAADVAGLTKRVFAESLGKYSVALFNFPPEDLIKDIKNA
jgi:predicted HTH domain antitoxin